MEGKINPGRQPHISKTVSMPGPAFYIPKGATGLKKKPCSSLFVVVRNSSYCISWFFFVK